MGKYIVKRVLLLIPTIFVVCAIVFILMRMVPGDAVDIIVNRMTQSGMAVDEAAVRARLGLDVPAFQQFFNWLWDVIRLDLGDSFFLNDSVANIIGRQLPISLELGVINKAFEPFERQLVADAVWTRIPKDAGRAQLFEG